MEWLVLAAPTGLLAAYLTLPGLAIGAALGLRGILALSFAPLLSGGVLAAAMVFSTVIGVGWGAVPVISTTALLTLLAHLASGAFRRRMPPRALPASETNRWLSLTSVSGYLAIAGSVLLWVRHLTNIMPSPSSISQTYDNVFHLNTINFIAAGGNPGPLLPIGLGLNPEATGTFFYPTAWHALAALAMPAADSVALASNAALLAVVAVAWPLSAIALVLTVLRTWKRTSPLGRTAALSNSALNAARPTHTATLSTAEAPAHTAATTAAPRITPAPAALVTPATVLATAVGAAAFPGFPFLLLDWGVLYPNMLGYAMIPAAIAAAAAALKVPADSEFPHLITPRVAIIIGAIGLAGITLAHPNALIMALALMLPLAGSTALTTWIRWRAHRLSTRKALITAAVLTAALLTVAAIWVLAQPGNTPWGPFQSIPAALREAALNNPFGRPAAWLISALMLVGMARIVYTRRHVWLLGSWAVATFLWVAAAAFPAAAIRHLLTAPWYSDNYRFAAAIPLVALPIAMLGVHWIATAITTALTTFNVKTRTAPSPARALTAAALTLALPFALIAGTQWSGSTREAAARAWSSYDDAVEPCVAGDVSCLLTADEATILARLPQTTPADSVILGDPRTGAALAYALSGREVLLAYIGSNPGPAAGQLLTALDDGDPAALCAAVATTGVTHVLDFGFQTVHSWFLEIPGIEDLADSPILKLADQAGDKALYEITGCN